MRLVTGWQAANEGEGATMQIDGTVAIVTGGTSGLGAATVDALVDRGAMVVVLDLREGDALRGSVVHHVVGDVTSVDDVARAVEAARELGDLRILVNCAGIGSNERVATSHRDGTVRAGDLDAFRRVIDINLVGSYNCMSQFAAAVPPSAPDQESAGVVVNTSSLAAFEGQVGQAAYSASKAGVGAMTFVAARDLGNLRIRVNAIAPGLMETPLFGTIREDIREGLIASVVHPPRVGRPSEFASLVCLLVEHEYLNGETIRLDAAARLPHQPRRPNR
jgi:NAD(P)-dependent dehydrogenase (short-subunit alcohol dehydrogenase family)